MAPLQIGILVYAYQVVDSAGPSDLLFSATKPVLEVLNIYGPVPSETIAKAPEFTFHYIGASNDSVVLGTSQMTIVPSTTVNDCPQLDILIVPGPRIDGFKLDPRQADFIRKHNASGRKIWTTCTGAGVLASTGVLDGKNATVNHLEYEWVKKEWPKVNWTKEKKWVIDGNLWTAAGAYTGTDMAAYWLKENYGLDVLTQTCLSLDYEPRDSNGLFNVLPKRYDGEGKQISTHVFHYYNKY